VSLDYVKAKRDELLRKYPQNLCLIRSAEDVQKVELRNTDMKGPFDNDDPRLIEAMESILAAGKQVAMQPVGPKQIALLVSKPGMKIFGVAKSSKDIAISSIMDELEGLSKQYINSSGNSLLTGGLDSYVYTEKLAAMAEKYRFIKHKSFAIDDFSVTSDVKRYLDMGRMVIVAAWGKEERIDVYLEPQMGGSSSPKTGGCFIATAVYGSAFAPEVLTFRQFRDEVLLNSRVGAVLVNIYYRLSPPLATLIGRSELFKKIARNALLSPTAKLLDVSSRIYYRSKQITNTGS
jgi:hypothetical protein